MTRVESLAQAGPGESCTLGRILFDGPRAYCADAGVHEGGVVDVLERDPGGVTLRTAGERLVRCPTVVARFIEVVPEAGTPCSS